MFLHLMVGEIGRHVLVVANGKRKVNEESETGPDDVRSAGQIIQSNEENADRDLEKSSHDPIMTERLMSLLTSAPLSPAKPPLRILGFPIEVLLKNAKYRPAQSAEGSERDHDGDEDEDEAYRKRRCKRRHSHGPKAIQLQTGQAG
ncbi:hypothetical protein EDB81DRAFT_765801 [Dactylonectria macrodidyma]|uniref:Uncharacterized protein n=1 Tax=Dactylonectria macrodidyma TaxID=307937 RepID=A0A9P9IL72_9HYPO|nr:hypothetical protein EDB81DRAFT_765801 [Dactylonectria macrodidyma]